MSILRLFLRFGRAAIVSKKALSNRRVNLAHYRKYFVLGKSTLTRAVKLKKVPDEFSCVNDATAVPGSWLVWRNSARSVLDLSLSKILYALITWSRTLRTGSAKLLLMDTDIGTEFA